MNKFFKRFRITLRTTPYTSNSRRNLDSDVSKFYLKKTIFYYKHFFEINPNFVEPTSLLFNQKQHLECRFINLSGFYDIKSYDNEHKDVN